MQRKLLFIKWDNHCTGASSSTCKWQLNPWLFKWNWRRRLLLLSDCFNRNCSYFNLKCKCQCCIYNCALAVCVIWSFLFCFFYCKCDVQFQVERAALLGFPICNNICYFYCCASFSISSCHSVKLSLKTVTFYLLLCTFSFQFLNEIRK